MPRVALSALRETIARIESAGLSLAEENKKVPLGHTGADQALLGGILPGALHEIYAEERDAVSASAFAAMLSLRVSNGNKFLLWVRQDFTSQLCGQLSAQGLHDLGLDPNRLLLVQTRNANEALRAASDSLSCKALGAIVLEVRKQPKALDLVASRKFTLRAGASRVTLFLIRISAPDIVPSTAETRWFVSAMRTPEFVEDWGNPLVEASLLRNRHGQTGTWAMEWSCDARVFREAPQNPRDRIPESFRGPHQADEETELRNASS
jgi:protein ImuA